MVYSIKQPRQENILVVPVFIRISIGDWRRLYEANVGVIGPDPNHIYPGQVLVVP